MNRTMQFEACCFCCWTRRALLRRCRFVLLESMSGTPSFARRRPISPPVRPVDVSASTSQTDSTMDDGHISSSVLATPPSVTGSSAAVAAGPLHCPTSIALSRQALPRTCLDMNGPLACDTS
jgi:hypothetical protein